MKISVVGTGYVGLVSGVCLAEKGHEVICVDVDQQKVARINAGDPPIFEEGLEPLLKKVIGNQLSATDDLAAAVRATDVTLIAVGTPFDGQTIDLSYIRQASREIGEALADKASYHLVVVKSTVVPGTTDGAVLETVEEASGKKAGVDFGIGMNPEFLTEGVAIRDFMNPDRIVVGGIDERSRKKLREIYAGFEDVPILETNTRTAELIKYASNALLATMISFSNEIANLATSIGGIDSAEVMRGVHLSEYLSTRSDGKRVKAKISSFLNAGCGFGGSCLPKDVKALVAQGQHQGLPMNLLDNVIKVNEAQPERMVEILAGHMPDLNGRTIGILGLAFKEGTDDMRESPAIPVARSLLKRGAQVLGYDPIAMEEARRSMPEGTHYARDLDEVVQRADALLLITRWDEFQDLPTTMANLDRRDLLLVDGRRFIDKQAVENYDGIGLS
jgi:UDPglucose 6-dehydrogenase/GDP-mannose 6-dehydrogenase